MKKEKIMTDEEYHNYKAISQSQIKAFLESPREFWKMCPYNPNKESKSSKALTFGDLVHTLLFEPEKYDEKFTIEPTFMKISEQKEEFVKYFKGTNEELKEALKNNKNEFLSVKDQKEKFINENQGKKIIDFSDKERAEKMIMSLRSNKLVNSILKGGYAEKPFFIKYEFEDTIVKKDGSVETVKKSLDLKAKFDRIKKLKQKDGDKDIIIIIDYKTSADVKKSYERNYTDFNKYHIQDAVYKLMAKKKFPNATIHMFFIIQSKKEGEEDIIMVAEYTDLSITEQTEEQLKILLKDIHEKLEEYKNGNKNAFNFCKNEIIEFTIPDWYWTNFYNKKLY